MKIYIDADGCPVVRNTLKIAEKFNITCVIICDTAHRIEHDGVETIVVEKGADSVDFRLVNLIQQGDIAITQDYGLAAMCLSKRAIVLNQDGKEYTNELCFRQYAARIRTIHKDYDGASQHIGAMLRKDNNNSAGHIEKAVRMLYMSEDDELTQDKRLEYKHSAEKAIDQYIAEHPNDNGYRSGVATALIGLSDHHYSLYEGVNCKIIDSEKDYNSILQLHEWAGKISDNDKIHNALNDIRKSGQRKFNTDNSKSLLCLTAMSLLYIFAIFDFLGAAFFNGRGFSCEDVLVILCLLIFLYYTLAITYKSKFSSFMEN